MTAAIQARDVERFRAAIVGRLGLSFDDGKSAFLADVLRRRVETGGHHSDAYLSRLETHASREELAALARELTVPETYFFRNAEQFRAFVEIVLEEHTATQGAERRLRLLSLGCASGEEPYSLAIGVRGALIDGSLDVSIVGVDVNPAVIEKARQGRFSAWALRETPDAEKRRWFRQQGKDFVLDESLRSLVRFEERNLIDDDPQFWLAEAYDVVFCRNVLMYFSPEQAQLLVARIARALRPGGYLFLGHAETLRGLSSDFHLRHTHRTFYYQRKGDALALPAAVPRRESRAASMTSLAAADADTWVDAIRRASERVASLTGSRRDAQPGASTHATRAIPAWDLRVIVEMLRQERFAEALALLDALPPESTRDPDVLLLQAVLLVHGGQLARAEEVCTRLLDADDMSAGAHYLLALCREGAADCAGAAHHDRVAAYLDPGFAMPRLHLGLLGRRAGDRTAARRELGHALVLLQREEASRVLLFGGGFGREALMALCRTELLRCGGQP